MTQGLVMQLLSVGSQDVFISDDPHITYWKRGFRRHSNFAMESINVLPQGTQTWGSQTVFPLLKRGDLAGKSYLETRLPELKKGLPIAVENVWKPWVGELIIQNVQFNCSGQKIDYHTNEWIHIYNTSTWKDKEGYAKLVGKEIHTHSPVLWLPLCFFWNLSASMALPLLCLDGFPCDLTFNFSFLEDLLTEEALDIGIDQLFVEANPSLSSQLWVDFTMVDIEERDKFVSIAHEYLVQIVQTEPATHIQANQSSVKVNMHIAHPTKALFWVMKVDDNSNSSGSSAYRSRRRYGGSNAQYSNFRFSSKILPIADEDADIEALITDYLKFTVSKDGSGTVGFYNPNATTDPAATTTTTTTGGNNVDAKFDFSIDELTKSDKQARRDKNNNLQYSDSTNHVVDSDNSHTDEISFKELLKHFNRYQEKQSIGPIATVHLYLNNQDRFQYRCGDYFNRLQFAQSGLNVPEDKGLYMYSFAINVGDEQPSGSCNMSRIEMKQFDIALEQNCVDFSKNRVLHIYAYGYNVFRILGGMCGLAYA